MGRKKKEGTVYLTESQRAGQRNKVSVGIRFPPEVIERLRNLVWATGLAGGVNGIIEEATIKALDRLEAQYAKQHGKSVPTRPNAKIDD